MIVSKIGIDEMIYDEVTSEANYRQRLTSPTVPSNGSGATIGIGYDLGMQSIKQVEADWFNAPFPLSGNEKAAIIALIGFIGEDAKRAIARNPRIRISYEFAYWVFINKTLPRFAQLAERTFPNITNLNADTQAVILSLVYNRGAGLEDTSVNAKKEKRREEMRLLVPAIKKGDYERIAQLLEKMVRLWDGLPDFEGDKEQRLGGLIKRYTNAARIVRASQRQYEQSELITID